jgi:hypothetical protein
MSAFVPNLLNAARVIETHQHRGQPAQGDPMRLVTTLIAPLMVQGLWPRAGVPAAGTGIDAEAVVAAFLEGHRAT